MKFIIATVTTLLVFSFCIHAQTIIHKQSFNKGLGAWRVNSPPNYVSPHDWKWYNNLGESSNPDSLGGLRSKHPSDSNYVASPAILLQAGKTYTVSFKTRMDQGSTDRLLNVGINTRRSLVGTNVFFTRRVPTNSYQTPPFTEYNPTFTVPSTGNYYLIFNFTENGYAFMYFDDVVVEESQYPTVSVTSPISGDGMNENYTDSTKVSLSATAADPDGNITKVEFLANDIKIAEDLVAPYEFVWKDVLPKDYAFTARATDNRGNVTTSTPVNYRVNLRDGTFKPYIHWDFNSSNIVGKGLDYWTLSGGNWPLRGGGFHGTDFLDGFSAYTNNFAASPGFYLQAGQSYQVEFLARASNKIIKLFLNKKQALNDSIPIDTVMIRRSTNLDFLYKKNITVSQSGTYHLIIHYPIVSNYNQIHFDNIRVIGNGLNIAPLAKITAPSGNIVAAQNSNMTLKSAPIDPDGSIQKVEYYANETKVGESSVPPNYEANWQNIPLGTYNLTARPIDNQNAQASSLKTIVRADTNRFSVSSLIGGTGDDAIRGIVFQRSGAMVIAANVSAVSHLNTSTTLLNGATADSSGVIIRLASDGKSILSFTRLCTKIADIAKDSSDNIYIAAWKSGIFKLNPTADTIRWQRIFSKPVHRVDAGRGGRNICMTATETDIDDGTLTGTNNYLHNTDGTLIYTFNGASQYGADVTIDETSATVITLGFKNFNTISSPTDTQALPVYVPVVRGYAYDGTPKYVGYDWSADATSGRWLNRSANNMADARLNRCVIGQDGKLYLAGQVYGGNHCFRYSPFDIMQPALVVGGDHYFNLSNTGTESHVFVGRYDPATGAYERGQTFTARLPSPFKGNSVFIDRGGIDADSSGRVYLTGASAWGLPLTTDYLPGEYTGGAYALVLSPNMAAREVCVRLALGHGRAIAVHSNKRWAFGGYADQSKEYLVNSFQPNNLSTTTKKWEAWLGYVNNLKCPSTSLQVSSVRSGSWSTNTTWECGNIPLTNHQITIEQGHTVTLPSGQTGKIEQIHLKGTLHTEGSSILKIK